MHLLSGLVLACLTILLAPIASSSDSFQFDRRNGEDITAITTFSEIWSLPLKDQPTSTIPSTTTFTKDRTTTTIPLKDETSTTTMPAKDEITTSDLFYSSTVTAKDQTTTASVPLKDRTSISNPPTKEETRPSFISVFSNVSVEDQTTSSTIPIKDQKSTSIVSTKDRPTTPSLFTSTFISAKDQSTSSAILFKDKSSTSTASTNDETVMSVGGSPSALAKDQPASTWLPVNNQSSTSILPNKDKATVTTECSSTALPTKDQTTSLSVTLGHPMITSTVPAKDETELSSLTTSSTNIPVKDNATVPTIPSKDQTGPSSVASKDINSSVLTVIALSPTRSISSTSASFEDQVYPSFSSAKDMITSSFPMTMPSFENFTALIPCKDQGSTIPSQPAKNLKVTSSLTIAYTEVLSLLEFTEGLYTTVTIVPTRDEPAMTMSHARSIALYNNTTMTTTIPAAESSPYSVYVIPSTKSGEFLNHSGKSGISTLSENYNLSITASVRLFMTTVAETPQKDETLIVVSSSLPGRYFPGFQSSSGASLPTKDFFTSALFNSAISPAPAPVITIGVLPTLPTVSTIIVPLDNTLGLIPLSSTSSNAMGMIPELPSPSAVFTLGSMLLSGMNSSESRELPSVFSTRTVSALVETLLGLSSLSRTSIITPFIVLTATKSTVASTATADSPGEGPNTTSPATMLASTQLMSSSVASPIIVVPLPGQTPLAPSSGIGSVLTPSSLVAPNTSSLAPTETLLSSLRAFNATVPWYSAISLEFVARPTQILGTKSLGSVLLTPTPTESIVEPSTIVVPTIGTPVSVPTGRLAKIPLYTPGLLGNAYGGGYITTPSIYVVVTSTPMAGVPPGYGYSVGPEGTTIILSISASPSFQSSEETSTLPALPAAPENTGFDSSGIAQSPGTSTSGNASFLAPLQPSSSTMFQGSASRYGAALLTLLLGLSLGFLIY